MFLVEEQTVEGHALAVVWDKQWRKQIQQVEEAKAHHHTTSGVDGIDGVLRQCHQVVGECVLGNEGSQPGQIPARKLGWKQVNVCAQDSNTFAGCTLSTPW